MKKILTVFCLILSMLFILCGCKIQDSSEQEEVYYVVNDVEKLFEDLKNFRNGKQQNYSDREILAMNNSRFSEINEIFVPTICVNEYKLLRLEVNNYNYYYYYFPDHLEESNLLDVSTAIVVSFSRVETSFEATMAQYHLSAENGLAYDSDDNIWFINNCGKRVSIRFPDDIIANSIDVLNEYFTFDKYVVASNEINKTESSISCDEIAS